MKEEKKLKNFNNGKILYVGDAMVPCCFEGDL